MITLIIILIIIVAATCYAIYKASYVNRTIRIQHTIVGVIIGALFVTIILIDANKNINKVTKLAIQKATETAYINAAKGRNQYRPEITIKYVNINGSNKELSRDTTWIKYSY